MAPELAITAVWVLWVASWIAAAVWSDPAAQRTGVGESLGYRIATVLGAALLFYGGYLSHLHARLWDLGQAGDWTLVAIAVLGLAFTWWARLYLGRLWSSSVTKKADHRVVDTGPYAIVRHPIYTGIILACAATAAQLGTALAVAGVLVLWVGFWIKARLEERFLRGQLEEGAYDAYRQKVPMLGPLGPRG